MKRLFALFLLISACLLAQPAPQQHFLIKYEPVRKDFGLQTLTDDERRIVGEHFAYLQRLQTDGKLVLAGQAYDPKGFWGILILNTPDAQGAAELMKADPAVKQNLVRGDVIPFRTVLMKVPEAMAAK